MFISSAPFGFFDYHRVPYTVDRRLGAGLPDSVGVLGRDGAAAGAPRLYWGRSSGRRAGRYRLAGFHLVGRLAPPSARALAGLPGPGDWREREQVLDVGGRPVADVWTDGSGSVFLPFDPAEAMHTLWSERYLTMGTRRARSAVRKAMLGCYYGVRPLLPRTLQLLMRRGYAASQSLPDFPGWPEEHSLHDMYTWLFDVVASVAGTPVPHLGVWPKGKDAALVLTHDVETALGRDQVEALRAPERELGLRSSWNFVPERYHLPEQLLERLREEGCEIGVHGLRHDGHDLASARTLAKRLPAIREYARTWGAVGFRSPATQRSWPLMPTLGFDYDSTYVDTAPHEPQPGGCCTFLPFFNEQLVELPMTLPMDHTLFEILGHTDGSVWQQKTRSIRDRGGMVLVLTHPDYVGCPGLLDAWGALLGQLADDARVWHALPREVSAWWRRRAASSLEPAGDTWAVRGPAVHEAEVRFSGRPRPPEAPYRTPPPEAAPTPVPTTESHTDARAHLGR